MTYIPDYRQKQILVADDFERESLVNIMPFSTDVLFQHYHYASAMRGEPLFGGSDED